MMRSDVVYELSLGRLQGSRDHARELLAEVTDTATAVLVTGRDNMHCSENFVDELIQHAVNEMGVALILINLPTEVERLARRRIMARKAEGRTLVVRGREA